MEYDYYKQYEPFFGVWKLNKIIGEGSFGRVYEIERTDFGKTYKAAMKAMTIPKDKYELDSILADGMNMEEAQTYFEQFVKEIVGEFELMSNLKGNSHVVSYEDHIVIPHKSEIGWDIFIRMELLTPLLSYIKTTTLQKRDVIKLGIDLCKALELCQKYNIIHRDIKPENIFISPTGDFKLGDFGIARTIEKTTSGLSKKGTYTYMAPEVYKGQPYGTSVDMYSLGIVLYRLLNHNRAPFMPPHPRPITYNDREKSLVLRMAGNPLPTPAGVSHDERLAEIVLKACAFNPKERYSGPTQMREDFEAILYTTGESPIIYPHGDSIEIKSIDYIDKSNDSLKATQVGDSATEEMSYGGTEIINDETEIMVESDVKAESVPSKNILNKKNIIAALCLLCILLIVGTSLVISIIRKDRLDNEHTINAVSYMVDGESISDAVCVTFIGSMEINETTEKILSDRFNSLHINFAYEKSGNSITLKISKTDVLGDVEGFVKKINIVASERDVKLLSEQGLEILDIDDFVKAEERENDSGYYLALILTDDGKEKLSKADIEKADIKICGNQIKKLNLSDDFTENELIIKRSDSRIICQKVFSAFPIKVVYADENGNDDESLVYMLYEVINGGSFSDRFEITYSDELKTEIESLNPTPTPTIIPSPAPVIEWKVEGYEAASPYKEYERKYVDGVATEETRYTGKTKPVTSSSSSSSSGSSSSSSSSGSSGSSASASSSGGGYSSQSQSSQNYGGTSSDYSEKSYSGSAASRDSSSNNDISGIADDSYSSSDSTGSAGNSSSASGSYDDAPSAHVRFDESSYSDR